MPLAKLTSKGQTTIPKDIRRHLGVEAGDRLRFMIEPDGRVVMVTATLPLRDLKGCLPKPPKAVSADEMKTAVKDRAGR